MRPRRYARAFSGKELLVMEIKTVAILGAGAIGSYFIEGLSDKLGENLWTVAEGARAERLAKEGIVVNGRRFRLNVRSAKEARGADLLIVIVKYNALKEVLPLIETIADAHTVVMSPLNGVDKEDIIASRIGYGRIVYSLMKVAIQRSGNSVTYIPGSGFGVIFGERDGRLSERVAAIDELLNGTTVNHLTRKNITEDIWYKFALNICRNLPQAVVGCGAGAYDTSEHLAYISRKMREEVVAVAAAKGIDISDANNPAGVASPTKPAARFSTLQDLDAKRATEIEMFSGALVRMGRELNVATPFNDFCYHAIKALEEKNAGLIE